MAKKGEVADIVSKAQYDYFAKQAKSITGKSKPLDDRGQPHRAKRDDGGRVTKPGGGKADAPPSAREAIAALDKFHNSGKTRDQLPDVSPTKNAARKDLEHAKMKNDKVVRPALRPPGSASYEKDQYARQMRAKYKKQLQSDSIKYYSNTISEEFVKNLDEALGL